MLLVFGNNGCRAEIKKIHFDENMCSPFETKQYCKNWRLLLKTRVLLHILRSTADNYRSNLNMCIVYTEYQTSWGEWWAKSVIQMLKFGSFMVSSLYGSTNTYSNFLVSRPFSADTKTCIQTSYKSTLIIIILSGNKIM